MQTNSNSIAKLAIFDDIVTQIYKTFDYDKFVIMDDNRIVNALHVKRLVESFKDELLICPIIVNERFEVIDGQHRLNAAIDSGMPVYYYMVKGYGADQVKKLNTHQKNWTKVDYLNSYASNQVQPYVLFKKFMADFPDFGFQGAERILSGLVNVKQESISGQRTTSKYFEEGKFFIPNLKKSYVNANKLLDFKPYYKNFNRGVFISCMLPLFDSKIYNHNEMIKKLKLYPTQMVDCVNTEQYRNVLEEIYNRRRSEKVSFKYL